MRKIILCSIFLLGIVGCTKQQYQRDTREGRREFITLEQMEQMIVSEDSFILVLGDSRCGSCAEFNEMIKTYILEHHVIIYEVILDFEETTVEENKKIIDTYFHDFTYTPAIYYVVDGKEKDMYAPVSFSSQEEFEQWVIKHQLDKK